MIREKQLKRQQEGFDKWKANQYIGLLNWATGVGKQWYFCYEGIQRYMGDNPNNNIKIVVNSPIVAEQWNNGLQSIKTGRDKILVYTIFQLIENPMLVKSCGLLIIDEADVYTSQLRRGFIDGTHVSFKHVLLLTATLFLIKKNYPGLLHNCPVIDNISLREAENLGFVAKSIEFNIGLKLPEKDKELYDKYTKTIYRGVFDTFTKLYRYLPYIGRNIDITMKKLAELKREFGTDSDSYRYAKEEYITAFINEHDDFYKFRVFLNATVNGNYGLCKGTGKTWISGDKWIVLLSRENGYPVGEDIPDNTTDDFDRYLLRWKPGRIKAFVIELNRALENRTKLLQLNKEKFRESLNVLKALNFPKTIVFTEATMFADLLYRWLNVYVKKDIAVIYHSKCEIPATNKDGTIKRWAKGNNKGKIIYLGKSSRKKTKSNPTGISALMEHNINKLNNNSMVLCAVKGLGRGFNYKELDLVLTTSFTNSQTEYYQIKGRGIRLKDDVDANEYIVMIVNLYFKETNEFWRLKNRQQSSQHPVYWIDDVGNIMDVQEGENENEYINVKL